MKEDYDFLMEFQKDLDFDRSAKASGISKNKILRLKNESSPYGQAMRAEMQRIQEDWSAAVRMNAFASIRKHQELMEKFEKDYDSADMKTKTRVLLQELWLACLTAA